MSDTNLDNDLGEHEPLAAQVVAAWASGLLDTDWNEASLPPLVRGPTSWPDPRLGWLSEGFSIIFGHWGCGGTPSHGPVTERRIKALRKTGWARALRLADLAEAIYLSTLPGRRGDAVDLLLGHGDAEHDPRPPAERFWTDAVLAQLLGHHGRAEDGLRAAAVAEHLAVRSGLSLLRVMAAQSTSVVFLSVGDYEGALESTRVHVALAHGARFPAANLCFNHTLCLVLCDRADEAVAFVDTRPEFRTEATYQRGPHYGAVQALALAEAGRTAEALALLARLRPNGQDDVPRLCVYRTWIEARTLLTCGQPQRAREVVEQQLAEAAAHGYTPNTQDGAQLYQALSRACESLGDLRSAMVALRQAQAHCAQWVGDSVQSRLHALRLEASSPVPGAEAMRRRAQAIDDLVARTVEEARNGVGDAQALPPGPRATVGGEAPSPMPGMADVVAQVAHVAHEMRNPVGGMIGMTSVLMLSQLNEQQRRVLDTMQASGRQLLQLCNDLLDLAKLEAGKFELQLEPTQVETLLQSAVAALAPLAQQKGLALSLLAETGMPPLLLDHRQYSQIVRRLASNAIERTSAGEVRIEAHWAPGGDGSHGTLIASVDDTDSAMDNPARAVVFDEFVPAADGGADDRSGLSLALCKSLVARMGGRIGVDRTPGAGNRFWFTLTPALAPG